MEPTIKEYMDTKKMKTVLAKAGISGHATEKDTVPHTANDKSGHKRNIRNITMLLTRVEQKLQKRLTERPSRETLDRLALFVGFQDWDSFCQEVCDRPASTESDSGKETAQEG